MFVLIGTDLLAILLMKVERGLPRSSASRQIVFQTVFKEE
jgi:hypothetical protein